MGGAGIANEHPHHGEISGIRAENCVVDDQQRFGAAVECDGQALTARKSNPLAMRLERLKLRHLFERKIYPHRLVVADFLTHGVTRERLEEQIADRGGYRQHMNCRAL